MTLAYLTGWRVRSEVLPLQWAQVDRKAKTVRLEPGTTKNADGRIFPYGLLPELANTIEAAWNEHQRLASAGTLSPYVFPQPDGSRTKDYRGAWRRACGAAGVPGRLVHDFRRTAVRNLVRAGVPDTVAMKLTGHKTRSVFDRYNVTSETDLADAVAKLAISAGKEKGKMPPSGRVHQFSEAR